LNPKNQAYPNYGGRGITVCKRWGKFSNFLADMEEPPAGTTLDRINNDLGYEPGNCTWSTRTEQSRNRRGLSLVTIDGMTLPVSAWIERFGIVNDKTAYQRIRIGWDPEKAVKLPLVTRRKGVPRGCRIAEYFDGGDV
jgi:hypothetical protein